MFTLDAAGMIQKKAKASDLLATLAQVGAHIDPRIIERTSAGT